MQLKITETINTVGWSEGVNNAPADLVTKAKAMAEEGKPATFGKIEGTDNWVVISANDKNELSVVLRG